MAVPRILLTTVTRPFGGPGEGDSVAAELFDAQVTRAQGIFSLRQVIRCWGLDYIAENISAETVVLHYPSHRELLRELRAASFDYVGINFVVATFHKLAPMVALIRRHAPRAKIILGGYGTVLDDTLLTPLADLICREEGIGYMRRLLGEDPDSPIRHPYAPIPAPRVYSIPLKTKVAHVTGGLGCPNGCDFCCTSHFFRRRYLPFTRSGQELFDTLRQMERSAEQAGETLSGFILIDEDFFMQEQRAREFLNCVRNSGRSVPLMGFGSIRGLSLFTADEIAEMGFDTLWIAFESPEAGYEKLKGTNPQRLYGELRSRGIAVLSSMIIGFPDQDRQRISREFNQLMALQPALCQFLIYFAFPGTPLYEHAQAQDMFLPAYRNNPDYRRWDGFSSHFQNSYFRPEELEALQKELFREEFQRLGPSLVRVLQVWFEGWRNLHHSPNPLLRKRARQAEQYLQHARHGLLPAAWFGPNRQRRTEARQLLAAMDEVWGTGPGTTLRRGAAVLLAAWTWLRCHIPLLQQPGLLRVVYQPTAAAAEAFCPERHCPKQAVQGTAGTPTLSTEEAA